VVAWNLTRRCNLECAHCYISAGPSESAAGELATDECLRIADEILAVNPAPMFILSGGEPLLRDDLETIAGHAAARGATVVVGTNGTRLTPERIASLKSAGVSGVAVSVDSLEPRRHDNFRHGAGALLATTEAVSALRDARVDVVIQTTVTRGNRGELPAIVAWAAEQGAAAFNAYFLVPTGRGARLADLSADEHETVLRELVDLHRAMLGRMLVRAKCAPQFMRLLHEAAPESPALGYETRCPCGVHYCRITPDGHLTPCPYDPTSAGDLRRERFADVWRESPLFGAIRSAPAEGRLGGRCGRCEYRGVCGGCRARALAVAGDRFAEDPACGYEPAAPPTAAAPMVAPPAGPTYGAPAAPALPWSPAAAARLSRIPSFVRGVVTRRIEDYARSHGHAEVTVELMREVRERMPVDFSKRRPFFLDDA
jgi:radical SAM protein with 4Fe4S-binding SPASM domain